MKRSSSLVALAFTVAMGCWNYRSQLERAEEHYRAGRYDAAVANLADLHHATDQLDRDERARYAWVRGMSHARLGQRAESRHWLALTREMLERGAVLTETERADLQRTWTEIDWVHPVAAEGQSPGAPTPAPTGVEPADTAPQQRARREAPSR